MVLRGEGNDHPPMRGDKGGLNWVYKGGISLNVILTTGGGTLSWKGQGGRTVVFKESNCVSVCLEPFLTNFRALLL